MSWNLLQIQSRGHQDFTEITAQVKEQIAQADWREGVVHLFVQHTTCGLTINENADPDVTHDLAHRLDELAPWEHSKDRHAEGNSAAHLKSSFMGVSLSIPLIEGRLQLGTWQGIYLAEFDGPRTRKILLQLLKTQ